MKNNRIYLQRRNKVQFISDNSPSPISNRMVSSILKNIEGLGYTFSQNLIAALQGSSATAVEALYNDIFPILKEFKNVGNKFRPMYQNFPQEVMEKSDAELYLNAIVHYLTDGLLMPVSEKKERFPLLDNVNLAVIDLGSESDFENLFTQIASSNTSLSIQDKEDLGWFIKNYGNDIDSLLPSNIPQKENLCYIANLFLLYTDHADAFVGKYIKSATDVLRLAVAMSGGDVSLAKSTKFRKFSRSERRFLVSLLKGDITDDLIRWKGQWKRLAHQLHIGEFSKKYPDIVKAFNVIRNDESHLTFNGKIESDIKHGNLSSAVRNLKKRPGDFARRLDHLLRLSGDPQEIVGEFSDSASSVSTPVLLQVMNHFSHRNSSDYRYFMPKGNISKIKAVPNNLPSLSNTVCNDVASVCRRSLMNKFENLPDLGKVYVDSKLSNYIVPFSQRSASKSLRTLTRGSRLSFDASTLRFFIWWKNGDYRTDIDLSAVMLDENYVNGTVAFYCLKGSGFTHSGDIVDAPNGASEFIDIDIDTVKKNGTRYVAMMVNSYTKQPYCDLPECFVGFMPRQHPNSGEIYDPKTVFNRIDLASDSKQVMPMVIDLQENKVIWCDLSISNNNGWTNTVATNEKSINMMVKSILEMHKPNLYDLLEMHAMSHGTLVDDKNDADVVWDEESGIQFETERIASEFLA